MVMTDDDVSRLAMPHYQQRIRVEVLLGPHRGTVHDRPVLGLLHHLLQQRVVQRERHAGLERFRRRTHGGDTTGRLSGRDQFHNCNSTWRTIVFRFRYCDPTRRLCASAGLKSAVCIVTLQKKIHTLRNGETQNEAN